MAPKAPFKRCTACPNKIPLTDGHDRCLFCLGESHQPSQCLHCKKLTKQALKQRLGRLRAHLWEQSLSPMERQDTSVASASSGSASRSSSHAKKSHSTTSGTSHDKDNKKSKKSSTSTVEPKPTGASGSAPSASQPSIPKATDTVVEIPSFSPESQSSFHWDRGPHDLSTVLEATESPTASQFSESAQRALEHHTEDPPPGSPRLSERDPYDDAAAPSVPVKRVRIDTEHRPPNKSLADRGTCRDELRGRPSSPRHRDLLYTESPPRYRDYFDPDVDRFQSGRPLHYHSRRYRDDYERSPPRYSFLDRDISPRYRRSYDSFDRSSPRGYYWSDPWSPPDRYHYRSRERSPPRYRDYMQRDFSPRSRLPYDTDYRSRY